MASCCQPSGSSASAVTSAAGSAANAAKTPSGSQPDPAAVVGPSTRTLRVPSAGGGASTICPSTVQTRGAFASWASFESMALADACCHQSAVPVGVHAWGYASCHAGVNGSGRPTSTARAASPATDARAAGDATSVPGSCARGFAGTSRAACSTARVSDAGAAGVAGTRSSRPGNAARARSRSVVARVPDGEGARGVADASALRPGAGAAPVAGGAVGRGAVGPGRGWPSGTATISPLASMRAARRGRSGSLRLRTTPTGS